MLQVVVVRVIVSGSHMHSVAKSKNLAFHGRIKESNKKISEHEDSN